jgi:hypothetical protein
MSQAVTELVIDADTSGADAYVRAMDGAADAAARGTDAASGFNLGFAALGAGVVGTALAIKQGIDYVVDFNKSLADMSRTAERTGLSLKDIQGIQFGGQISGLSDSQINTGLEKSAQLLNDAQRNANTLSKEFEANGLSIRNANGQLISQNQLLQAAADLVKRAASPQDALAIAQMLGFTKEWVPLLQQGAGAIRSLGDEAQKAGSVIDDETVKRAVDFDEKWRKSSVEWSTYMKAAIADMLPAVDDFIDRAVKLIADVKQRAKTTGDIPQAVAEAAAGKLLDAAGGGQGRGIAIDVSALEQAQRDWQNSPTFSTETWTNFGKALWNGFTLNATPQEAERRVPGLASKGVIEPSYPTAAQMDAAFDKANPPDPGSRQHPIPGLTAADYANDNASKVAAKDQPADAVDRAINSLTKHTAAQEADAKAVGLGDAALAGFRVEAAETAAVLANGGKETDAQSDAFDNLRERAIAAADALARAKVASQISFDRQTVFLGPQDLQIAQQLKGIYGNDIPTALNSSEAAQLRFNQSLRQMSSLGQDVNRSFFVEFTQNLRNGASFMSAFETAGLSALGKISDKLAQMAADQLWSAAFGGSSGGAGGLLGLLGGGSGSAAQASSAATLASNSGGAFYGPGFADGTDAAPGGPARVNEQGGEILNLPSGTQVIPHDVSMAMARSSGASSGVHVSVGVTVDDDGKLQAYVKNVSQATTAQGIGAYAASPQFVDHVGAASSKARSRRL